MLSTLALSLVLQVLPQEAPPDASPSLRALRVTEAPIVDGALDDSVWSAAEAASGLRQRDPSEGAPASEATEVRVVYDDETLYVAARLWDRDPSLIRATELRRDDRLESDDSFALLLDTYRDGRNGFVFRVNPLGTRFDATVRDESRFLRADWDEQWEAAARITEEGWEVEMAIPFKILRFTGDDTQAWGLNLERVIKRRNEAAYWSGWARSYDFTSVSQAGSLDGLQGIERSERFRLRPYVLAGGERLDATTTPAGTQGIGEIGVDDFKWAVTSSLTADFAVNPDFAQTEVDQQRVNLTRFSLFFPEKRQFFVEGGDAMRTGINLLHFGPPPLELFYSRRVGLSAGGEPLSILGGAKLTGKPGGVDVGFLSARTAELDGSPGETFTAARFRREVGGRSYVGGLFTDRTGGGLYNRVLAADANLILFEHLQVAGLLARSFETDGGDDRWVRHAALDWRDDFLEAGAIVLDIAGDFDPGLGYVMRRERMTGARVGLKPRPGWQGVRQLEIVPGVVFFHDDEGDLQTRRASLRLAGNLESGDRLQVDLQNQAEVLESPFPIAPGVQLPPGEYHWSNVALEARTFNGRPLSGTVSLDFGDFYGGRKRSLEVRATARPGQTVSLEPSYGLNDVELPEGSFRTHLLGLRGNVSFSRSLLTSAFLQSNSAGDLQALQVRLNYIFRGIDNLYLVYNVTRFTAGSFDGRSNQSLVLKATYSLHR